MVSTAAEYICMQPPVGFSRNSLIVAQCLVLYYCILYQNYVTVLFLCNVGFFSNASNKNVTLGFFSVFQSTLT